MDSDLNVKDSQRSADEKRSKRIRIICHILAVILLILLLLRCCGHQEKADTTDPRPNTVDIRSGALDDATLAGMTDDEIVAELNRQVQASMITMTINPEPSFQEGKGNLLIENDESNNGPVVVEIKRNDTGELVYTSPVIPLGKRVNTAALDVELPTGDYPATAYFHYVDEVTGEILGTGGVAVTLHIL